MDVAEREGLQKASPSKYLDCLTGHRGPTDTKGASRKLSNRDGPHNKNAALVVEDQDGEEVRNRFAAHQKQPADNSRTGLILTSVRFAPCFTDDGKWFGLEVVR